MKEHKENLFVKFLKWLGIVKSYSISNEEMCKQVRDTCNRQCKYCAWYESDDV